MQSGTKLPKKLEELKSQILVEVLAQYVPIQHKDLKDNQGDGPGTSGLVAASVGFIDC